MKCQNCNKLLPTPRHKKWCSRRCMEQAYDRAHPEKRAAIATRQRKRNRQQYKQYKNAQQCAICDGPMEEFHHIKPKEKVVNVSQLVSHSQTWPRIKKEIDKCIPVCRGCHRLIEAYILIEARILSPSFTSVHLKKAKEWAKKAHS